MVGGEYEAPGQRSHIGPRELAFGKKIGSRGFHVNQGPVANVAREPRAAAVAYVGLYKRVPSLTNFHPIGGKQHSVWRFFLRRGVACYCSLCPSRDDFSPVPPIWRFICSRLSPVRNLHHRWGRRSTGFSCALFRKLRDERIHARRVVSKLFHCPWKDVFARQSEKFY